jgi:hypothetical protein
MLFAARKMPGGILDTEHRRNALVLPIRPLRRPLLPD